MNKYPGLNDKDVLINREKYGFNILSPPKKEPAWKLLLDKFTDPIIRILLVAIILSFAIQSFMYYKTHHAEFIEPVGITIAVILAVSVNFFNEYKANKEFEVLNKFNEKTFVQVIRNNIHQKISKDELVVGDIVILETGHEIPADGEILESADLHVNESKLTGESIPVKKSVRSFKEKQGQDVYEYYKVYNGTIIAEGHGIMVVVSVGDKTEIGKIAKESLEETFDKTPLEKQLTQLSKVIGIFGYSFAFLLFIILSIRGIFFGEIVDGALKKIVLNLGQWYFVSMIFIGLIFLLAPLWLPSAFDILKIIFKRKEAFHLRHLLIYSLLSSIIIVSAGLYLGSFFGFSYVFTDNLVYALEEFLLYFTISVTLIVVAVPEGLPMSTTISLAYSMRKMMKDNILTKNMLACETLGAITVICSDKTGTLTMNEMRISDIVFNCLKNNKQSLDYVIESFCINSTSHLDVNSKVIGNPTEGSLLLWLKDKKIDYTKYRDNFAIDKQVPFSTHKKLMYTSGFSNIINKKILYSKGAPEIILENSTKLLTSKNTIIKLSSKDKENIHKEIIDYQSRGMRVLGFGYKVINKSSDRETPDNLVWLGFAVINDPIRPDIKDAIKECLNAGIDVKIVTGDNAMTAKEIGRTIGLIDNSGECNIVIGIDFEKLNNDQLKETSNALKILARARPQDKLLLVKSLKQQGHVVAVTGDGVNDAPAINNSDIGISMGKTGTSITKEAADLILLDDSFKSIINGIKWGRGLYLNIQRFILFQLTINFTAMLMVILGPFLGIKIPLTIIQMLWLNLIMDTFAAIALSTEHPHNDLMHKKPRNPDDFIITKEMAKRIFLQGSVFVLILSILLIILLKDGITPKELTIFFTVFVMLQFWNLFNARTYGVKSQVFHNLSNNKSFLLIAALIFIGQIIIVEFGSTLFRTVPLSLTEWVIIIISTSLIIIIPECYNFIKKIRHPKIF